MKIVRTVVAWLAVAAILGLGFAWLAGWFNERVSPGSDRDPLAAGSGRSPSTVSVDARREPSLLPVPGRLWATDRTRVASEITGKIVEMGVVAGDSVEPGTVLVKLDPTELRARVERIRERLPAEENRVQEARAQLQRDRELLRGRAVSEETVETSRRILAEAESALAGTQQELVAAEGRLEETVIKATKGGIAVDQLAKPGEVARPGVPLLEIYHPDTLRLEAAVPESLASGLQVGQQLMARFGADARRREVTVDEIVPQADQRSRTILVKATLDESTKGEAGKLLEGQYGQLFVPVDLRTRLSLPAAAIQSLGQLDFVEVVTKQRGVERRYIKRGAVLPEDRVEILSGLDRGERVTLPRDRNSSRNEVHR